jgi:hypothetical protein
MHRIILAVGHEILNLVAIEGEEFSPTAREDCVFHDHKEQAAERRRLFPQPAMQIEDDPGALVQSITDGEGSSLLADDVPEVLIGG